jgi:hypothetical protein
MFYMLYNSLNPPFLRYIEVIIDLAICFPTRNRVTVLLQPFPGHNSNSFLSIYAYKLYMYQIYQQNSHLFDFGPL